ncbi:MAG: class I SAM-dependent methyltransferase [Bacteroidia bacterium]|nr:class I SAM-dependent methyltransferase [Bacteroidia bacterium]
MKQRHFRTIIFTVFLLGFYQIHAQTVEDWEIRINERQPIQKVIETIGLQPGMVIGEVGAGTGRITVWFAKQVGPEGLVYANDINKTDLNHLFERCKKEGFNNVKIIVGSVEDPKLPANSLDIAFMTNTYHHLEKPVELVRNLLPTLKKNGIRQPPKKIMDAIGVKPGMVIGEIGAGRGRFTVYLARETGPTGKILANDIDKRSLESLEDRCKKNGFANVETIIGKEDDPLFPDNSLDLAIMVYTYHHLSMPDDLLRNLKHSLKPGSILAILEMRDFELDKELHIDRSKSDQKTPPIRDRIEKSARETGYELIRIETFIESDYIFILQSKE